jgi:hypothetical protein
VFVIDAWDRELDWFQRGQGRSRKGVSDDGVSLLSPSVAVFVWLPTLRPRNTLLLRLIALTVLRLNMLGGKNQHGVQSSIADVLWEVILWGWGLDCQLEVHVDHHILDRNDDDLGGWRSRCSWLWCCGRGSYSCWSSRSWPRLQDGDDLRGRHADDRDHATHPVCVAGVTFKFDLLQTITFGTIVFF